MKSAFIFCVLLYQLILSVGAYGKNVIHFTLKAKILSKSLQKRIMTMRKITMMKRVEVEKTWITMMNTAEVPGTMRIIMKNSWEIPMKNMRQSITLFLTAINIRESYEL